METVSVSQRDCLPGLTQAEHLHALCGVSILPPPSSCLDTGPPPSG